MGFHAKIDENNVVTEIVYVDDDCDANASIYLEQIVGLEGPWVYARAAKNSVNHADIGAVYIENLNIFMPPKPFNSWIMRQNPESLNYYWTAPVDYPDDGKRYGWDESSVSWTEALDSE